MPLNIEALRAEFPVTQSYIYLNHAAVAPISISVQRAMNQQVRDVTLHGIVHSDRWENTYRRTRRVAAQLIHAKPSEIAFIKNTTEGIQIVANGIKWKRGDNVVITDRGFPANVYPWINLKSRGVETRFAPETDGRIAMEQLFDLVDKNTRIISISSVEFASGFRHDLTQIGEFCTKNGILFFVDAIQSLGALNLNVAKSHIDFLSADAHKWLLGPEGAGVFYCAKKAMRHLHVNNLGWASVKNPGDYLSYDPTPLPNAQRFESGTLNTAGIYGLKACLDFIQRIGIENIESRILMLTDQLVAGLKEKGYDVLSSRKPDEKSGIVSFSHPRIKRDTLFQCLHNKQVICALRGNGIRLSPHVYNTEEEIDHVLNILPE
ncbi:MAG: aminotransferase class V-fold PLP-dependent enzyme [Candidatus Latescibacteria bacterium]|jgi:cysteine desulfurase / selenocysteine lyase|nr:aminotransferase class V-fold PLP-dependent enzyme [Candidatus Latescibacterota bacterium]MBT5832016.1 aminotransferase class V-fold PLP-dependent enzyme [Candidatus Latescibacterota bacterium]